MSKETLDPVDQTRRNTKEGYYICRHVPIGSDEMVLPLHGPNIFPDQTKLSTFQETMEKHYTAMCKLEFEMAKPFDKAAGKKGKFDGPGMFDKPMAAFRLLHCAPGCGERCFWSWRSYRLWLNYVTLHRCYQGSTNFSCGSMRYHVRRLCSEYWRYGEKVRKQKFKLTLHRVMNVLDKERYSVPFFFEPNFACQVECFSNWMSDEKSTKYPPTTSGQHLLAKNTRPSRVKQPSDIWNNVVAQTYAQL